MDGSIDGNHGLARRVYREQHGAAGTRRVVPVDAGGRGLREGGAGRQQQARIARRGQGAQAGNLGIRAEDCV